MQVRDQSVLTIQLVQTGAEVASTLNIQAGVTINQPVRKIHMNNGLSRKLSGEG